MRIVDEDEMRRAESRLPREDKPTNVLSFPAEFRGRRRRTSGAARRHRGLRRRS